MQITILCVGRVKEKFYRDAIDEYAKRLSRYCRFNIIEVADEMTPDKISDAERDRILKKEGDRLIEKLPSGAYIFSLEIQGHKYTSEKLASKLADVATGGVSSIAFIIGGSLGLHREVTDRADEHISFSDMTFPHQLMRVILSEQIYRCYRINNNEPYHK